VVHLLGEFFIVERRKIEFFVCHVSPSSSRNSNPVPHRGTVLYGGTQYRNPCGHATESGMG
ncbi:MAG: hypothetical protein ACC654_11420, partial [Acidimicrobiia bacterium]